MIDFGHSLNTAWERTKIILFHGDGAKWALIGCNAFLMMMGRGSVSFNNPLSGFNQNGGFRSELAGPAGPKEALRQVLSQWESSWMGPLMLVMIGVGTLLFIAWVAMLWAGSRGEFMFLDNVVRNRAAVAEPWKRYAREGNRWFLVNLAFILFSLVMVFGGIGAVLAEVWPWIFDNKTLSEPQIGMVVLTGLAFFAAFVAYALFAFIFRTFVVPLYFKQTMTLGQCFASVLGLITKEPVSIATYVLVSIGLGFLQALLTILVIIPLCCVLCWASCVPFVGSIVVMLVICEAILPVLVYVRCFQLECLAQFGPQFDVWKVDVETVELSRPPQPG